MLFFKTIGGVALMFCLYTAAAQPQETRLDWFQHYAEARAAAQREGRWLIVSLETNWCSWCRVMEEQVFTDPDLMKRYGPGYIWVRMDAEATPEGIAAHRKFRSESYPFTTVVDPKDELFVSILGFRDVQGFAHDLDDATAKLESLRELKLRVKNGSAGSDEALKLVGEYEDRGLYVAAADILESLRQQRTLANADQILFSLAICRASAGESERALDDLAEFRKQFPQSALQADAEAMQWEIEFRLNHRGPAIEHLRAWLKQHPDHRLADHVRLVLAQHSAK